MIAQRKLFRFQLVLLSGAAGLLLLYALAYRPLSREATELDKPLTNVWKRLIDGTRTNEALRGLDDLDIQASRSEVERQLAVLQQAAKQAHARIELEPELRAKLKEPFQLVEFDQTKLQTVLDLRRLAEAKKVLLAEAAIRGFPEFTSDLAKPSLLWAQLAFVKQLLTLAVEQQPAAIRSLTLLPPKAHVSSDGKETFLEELPLHLELNGPVDAVVGLLRSLPLRSTELKEQGLREVVGKHQPLFLDHFILKNSTNALNDASLDLLVSGFVSPN
jgi:hypothetical protein